MELCNQVKFDSPNQDVLVWKFPSEELRLGSQVIVNQSQEAVFVKGGKVLDVLGPGTHTLETGNIPILSSLIKLPFNGKTPFTAEVWFVNTTVRRGLKWGTPGGIQVIDPEYQYPITVRAFGEWGIRIFDSISFLQQLVGSQKNMGVSEVEEAFSGEIVQKFSNALGEYFKEKKSSIFEINSRLTEISDFVQTKIIDEFKRFGIEIVNFNINRISIPEEEQKKIQEILGKKLEVKQLSQEPVSQGYMAIQALDALKTAAGNQNAGGLASFVGTVLGMGTGASMLANAQNMPAQTASSAPAQDADSAFQRLQKLKSLYEANLITEDEYNKKKELILKDI